MTGYLGSEVDSGTVPFPSIVTLGLSQGPACRGMTRVFFCRDWIPEDVRDDAAGEAVRDKCVLKDAPADPPLNR